jgi:endonuclease/exonuclease/phosphatase family metal-dependent hydrolase
MLPHAFPNASRDKLTPTWALPLSVLIILGALGRFTPAYAAPGDIVIYASDIPANAVHGAWSVTSDPTSPNGTKLATPATDTSTTGAPLASPTDYVDVTFTANTGVPYTFWIRLKAFDNSKWSDSLWVQFSDALLSGSPIYPMNSTSGLLVNLATDSTGSSDVNWGWVNGCYWLTQPATVTFATSGTHTVRVQVREAGVELDQIVLSPSTYLNAAPGLRTNDTTILADSPGTSSPAPTSPPVSSTLAYGGVAPNLPGDVSAANFDTGGAGVSYYSPTPGNPDGVYRSTGIALEASSIGGYDVGWIVASEWLNFTVNVTSAGAYTAQIRVASPSGGGSLHIGFNTASSVWAVVPIPATGGWQTWTTVNVPVTLGAGVQQMTMLFDTGGFNLHDVNVVAAAASPGAPAAPNGQNVANGATGVTVTPNLSWQAAGATAYDLLLWTTNQPALDVSNLSNYWYSPPPLLAGTTYYWQVVAINSLGSTPGPIWSFTTVNTPSAPPPPSGAGNEVTVVQWNIEVDDSSVAHAQTAMDLLMATSPRPQIITVAEAWLEHFNDYINELEAQTGQTWYGAFATHCPPGDWNGTACTVAPTFPLLSDQGVGIFSTFPIVSSSSILYPFPDCYTSARAALRAAINVNGTIVQVFTNHLQTGGCENDALSRDNSMAMLKTWAASFPTPQLVSGDFNADVNQIDTTAGMLPNFVDSWSLVGSGPGYTCATPSPTMKLDYWFADASGKATPNWAQVVTSTGTISDHYPLLTSFTVQP